MANPEDLGRFRLKRLLGRGNLGEVWEAADVEQPGSKVAVKIMHAADEELSLARSHFAREARLASLLRHPHVVTIYDAGEAAGTSFMVMEMVEGRPLRALLADPATTIADKLRWLSEIADALAALHEAGLAHRDLKPENVIVRADGTACLVDLGIAKWIKFDLGFVRSFGGVDDLEGIEEIEAMPDSVSKGSPSYVPPETTEQSLYDELGDQYAWGVLAYEALTGDTPTESSEPLSRRVRLPAPIADAIDQARSKLRKDRHEGMEPLLAAIAIDPSDVDPRPGAPTGKPPRRSSRPAKRTGAAEDGALGLGMAAMVGIALAFIAFILAILMDLRPSP